MKSYSQTYTTLFAGAGVRLAKKDACTEGQIAKAEARLGVKVPRSLREYFLVAGCEKRFNRIQDRLLSPQDWFIAGKCLAFLVENQAVVFWGVEATSRPKVDPPVFQGTNAERISWRRVQDRCSVFLATMFHWHGAYGGAYPHIGTCAVPVKLGKQLEQSWSYAGEVNRMRAFHRDGQSVCFLKWRDPFTTGGKSPWRVFAGATTAAGLQALAEELKVTLERW